MPLLVIASQHFRVESEICSKRNTFNRRHSGSSELCNHHIICYEPAVLFPPLFCSNEWGFVFNACPFWMFSTTGSCICSNSLREGPSVASIQNESALAAKERYPLSCLWLSVWECAYISFSAVPEPCRQVKATTLVSVKCVVFTFQHVNTFPSIWRSSPLTHYTVNQQFTVYANPTHLPRLTHSQSDISQKTNTVLCTTIHS